MFAFEFGLSILDCFLEVVDVMVELENLVCEALDFGLIVEVVFVLQLLAPYI